MRVKQGIWYVSLLFSLLFLVNCASSGLLDVGRNQGEKGALDGALIGAGLGAITGQLAGQSGAATALGAAAGAVGGAVLGGALGAHSDQTDLERQRLHLEQNRLSQQTRDSVSFQKSVTLREATGDPTRGVVTNQTPWEVQVTFDGANPVTLPAHGSQAVFLDIGRHNYIAEAKVQTNFGLRKVGTAQGVITVDPKKSGWSLMLNETFF